MGRSSSGVRCFRSVAVPYSPLRRIYPYTGSVRYARPRPRASSSRSCVEDTSMTSGFITTVTRAENAFSSFSFCRAKAAACASMPGSFTRLPRSLAVSSREKRGGR